MEMPRRKMGKKVWQESGSPHNCENYCKHYLEAIEHGEAEPTTVCESCLDHNVFEVK